MIMSKAKRRISAALGIILCLAASTKAEVVITDAGSGLPLAKASIFDRNGLFIATTDNDGLVPETIGADAYPINVRYVGFKPVDVKSPDYGTVLMRESSYELPEVEVNDKNRNILHITAYVRDYGSLIEPSDTMNLFTERIVDFMLPLNKKAGYKGWTKPRVLAEREYSHIIKNRKDARTDSMRYSETHTPTGFNNALSDKFEIPQELTSGKAKKVTYNGKYGPKDSWVTLSDSYILNRDLLADTKNHVFSPKGLKLFGMTTDVIRNDAMFNFDRDASGVISPDQINEAAYHFSVVFKGKAFRWISGQNDPININCYGELFVIDREYLTADEAKALKKNPPVYDAASFTAPLNIPDLPAEVIKLKDEVIKANSEK